MQSVIHHILETSPPRSKSLIVSLLGDSIKPRGGDLWLGTLISACEPFDINERAVRTSVQRLSRDGWLKSERHGRKSRYCLTTEGRSRIDQASPRMYSPPVEDWDERCTVAFAPPGSLQAWERAQMRKYLEWEGYCMAASGFFFHPLGNPETLSEILTELKIEQHVYVFAAETFGKDYGLALKDGVGEFWDLDLAREHYGAFIETYQPILSALENSQKITDAEAFQIRLLTIHAFRRASLHAPRLPATLFPDEWPGVHAYELCKAIYQKSWVSADKYLQQIYTENEEDTVRPADYFFLRFGGLESPPNSSPNQQQTESRTVAA